MAINVENISTKILKKDNEDNTISFALKADVTNIKGDEYSEEEVNIEIQGVDSEGFEIISVYLSGNVKFGTTKTLTSREDYQDHDEFKQVMKWQYAYN